MRFCIFLLSVMTAASQVASQSPPSDHSPSSGKFPATKRQPVTDTYHSTSVTEDYRWLENFQDPAVRAWSAEQNTYARKVLDGLGQADAIRKQVTDILSAQTVSYGSVSYRGGKFFAIKRQPPKQQAFIIAMDSLDDVDLARVIVDPNLIDAEGTTHIDWYKASPDGSLIAVSMSRGGSEIGNLSIYEVATANKVHEEIPNVNSGTAGGSLAWLADGSGFFYTKHFKVAPDDPLDQNVFQHVYLHKLGTPIASDQYELGKGFPQIAEIQLAMDDSSGRLLATVQEGDGGEFAHHLRNSDGQWRQFSSFGDGTKQAVFGKKDDLYVVRLTGAPRGQIVRVPIATLNVESSPVVIPEGEDTIVTSGIAFWGETTVLPTEDRLYVVYQLGGPSELRVFDYDGKPLVAPKQLDVSAIHGLMLLDGSSILFGNTSYTEPDAYYQFSAATGTTTKTKLATLAPTTLSDAKVIRRFAKSKDGTRVPLNIILPAGVEADGTNPCVVYGYGGYGVNLVPRFRPLNRILMDRKVIYAVANIRGGGEFGESWHLQGNLTNKQNVFDDFAACVSYMTESGYTTPDRTAILGGSNGGLLMGATLTQHPDDVKAVVALVGIYDMLRVELSPNGAFNVTEFGTVKKPDQFKAFHAYSPYHNVKDGVKYPAVLFMTGENDPRVDPMQSRKMTARLQAATASGLPVLLRTSANAGHGSGNSLSEQVEQSVDLYAFLFDQLGVDERPSVARRLEQYVPVDLTTDLSQLSAKQREMIPLLIEAGKIMDQCFWYQAYGNSEQLLRSIDDPTERRFAEINYGPWDRLDGNNAFISGVGKKPSGANFYPSDMTKDEFEKADLSGKDGLYTFIRRAENGGLKTVPYHEQFETEMKRAAALLRDAAALAEDSGLRHYLMLRAEALVTDDYQPSDLAWLDMHNNTIDVVIGPIENYEDQLYGYKTAYECYVLVKDKQWSGRLAKYAAFLPELQQSLPVPNKYKQEKPGTDTELNAYDVVYYAGDCNAGSKTIAINLPNDEQVQLQKGTRRLQLKNAMRAKFEKILLPIADELIAADQRKHITFDAFFSNTMFHEVAHGLGIKNTINGQGAVRTALREHAGAIEEGKADVLGLHMINQLHERGEIKADLNDFYVTFMAGIFRSVRFGASSAHGKANMIRFNYFRDAGAFERQADGKYRVNVAGFRDATRDLSSLLLRLQGDGDYAQVKKLVDEKGVIGPALQAELDLLSEKGIPVDIVFNQGVDVLGL